LLKPQWPSRDRNRIKVRTTGMFSCRLDFSPTIGAKYRGIPLSDIAIESGQCFAQFGGF